MSRILDDLYFAKANRFGLIERFQKRPALNAVIGLPGSDSTSPTAAALAAFTIANRDFEVLGTNMTTALCTFAAGGGITLTTAGADNDQAIVLPHLDTTQTPWAVANQWASQQSPSFETLLVTGASVAAYIAYAGFKLTNTPTVATDDDQVFVRVDSAHATYPSQFVVVHSRDGADVETPTGITVAASTAYRIAIDVDSDRRFAVSINNKVIAPAGNSLFPALVTGEDFKPYIGVAATGAAAAKAVTVRYLACSRAI